MPNQRLIICTDSAKFNRNAATAVDRNNVTAFLEGQGWQVWHWFEDLWLVIADGRVDVRTLRDQIVMLIGPLKHVLVIEVSGQMTYSGLGPPTGWPWMAQNWGTPK